MLFGFDEPAATPRRLVNPALAALATVLVVLIWRNCDDYAGFKYGGHWFCTSFLLLIKGQMVNYDYKLNREKCQYPKALQGT